MQRLSIAAALTVALLATAGSANAQSAPPTTDQPTTQSNPVTPPQGIARGVIKPNHPVDSGVVIKPPNHGHTMPVIKPPGTAR